MIIDGKKIAKKLKEILKTKILVLKDKKPTLCVISVGQDPASLIYIKTKKRACEYIGINFHLYNFDEKEKEKVILNKIDELNQSLDVDGILIQMPLPKHINSFKVIERIDPNKDVDGFHPINMGKLLIGDDSGFIPCTPLGIKTLFEKKSIEVQGKHVVIVGRSNIVGKPLACMLVQKKASCNATVTLAHSCSKNLKEITRSANILIAAIGKANFITKEMISHGSIVIDVGINRIKQSDGTTKIVGDVDFENVCKITSYITPVPGGVGPMTVAMLLENTYLAFQKKK